MYAMCSTRRMAGSSQLVIAAHAPPRLEIRPHPRPGQYTQIHEPAGARPAMIATMNSALGRERRRRGVRVMIWRLNTVVLHTTPPPLSRLQSSATHTHTFDWYSRQNSITATYTPAACCSCAQMSAVSRSHWRRVPMVPASVTRMPLARPPVMSRSKGT